MADLRKIVLSKYQTPCDLRIAVNAADFVLLNLWRLQRKRRKQMFGRTQGAFGDDEQMHISKAPGEAVQDSTLRRRISPTTREISLLKFDWASSSPTDSLKHGTPSPANRFSPSHIETTFYLLQLSICIMCRTVSVLCACLWHLQREAEVKVVEEPERSDDGISLDSMCWKFGWMETEREPLSTGRFPKQAWRDEYNMTTLRSGSPEYRIRRPSCSNPNLPSRMVSTRLFCARPERDDSFLEKKRWRCL